MEHFFATQEEMRQALRSLAGAKNRQKEAERLAKQDEIWVEQEHVVCWEGGAQLMIDCNMTDDLNIHNIAYT